VDAHGKNQPVKNPRFPDQAQRQKLKLLQQALSRKTNKRGRNRRQAVSALAKEPVRIASRRKDFLHQESSKWVTRCGLIATEPLNVKGMTAHGGAYKTGLNRRILDTAPSAFLSLLKSQAEEAGLQWMDVPTRPVQPSQPCQRCGGQRKKPLSERRHGGDCGANCSRDENAAKVMLNWALTGSATGRELTEAWNGGSSAVSKWETPAVLA
jgi:putative transposase